mmetsp:Transcript_15532/g.33874  ORF Transcript_15532/g.33874 Transcript_15532/m.33874 type:complete len:439 (-) Transcript_15532:125-1441(-)|eukprot:CAMPEP_0172526062 /NCGR_PEP_ID=MMETSP1067-20121228/1068_1 /TAXON_ID=265564 ORGANISM="Thalassiosira punctigera, Strain Tpunct2005C2" /NCGR_SAMPLE_ID=MMETSP1067 /ASSEMBLY_ACC=CAM_ASM_000444 /LENGTH=438 /DNA_ID=CAMNT_0013309489 /DNA_START=203 /DNA_END=1519 /DNA_ORIENTATION=+
MGRVSKKKKQTPPPVDKFLKPAAGVAVAMLAYYFMKGMTNDIPRIDVADELALREVFFGEGAMGKDYAVLCHPEAKDGSVGLPVSSVFQDSHDDGSAPAEYVLLDCDYVLPDSGKSIYDKFKLNKKKRPTVFVSGKVGPPKQVPEKHLKTGAMLTKLLKQMLEPHAAKIEKTKELKEKCLNKEVCGLLLKGGKPEPYVKHAVANLLGKYPNVQFASVDSTVLFLTNLEEYLPEYEAGVHRFVVFKKVSGGISAGDNETKAEGRLKTSILPLETAGVSFGSISTLVSDALNGKQMKNIPALPNIKTRTKKLEESERQKRDRKKDQARRKAQEDQKPPQQTFTANDGSKDGRRLERERRRAEHNAANNIKPKTPEEIAEMERSRRQRMEEEAAKWNIGAEDAPEAGEPVEEEWMDSGDEEGGEYVDEDEEEDDEDVLDLD